MNSPKLESKRNAIRNRRITIIGAFISVLYAIVALRVIYVQVIGDEFLSESASSQYLQKIESRGKRGVIYDAKGRELAINTEVVEIGVHPRKIRKLVKRDEIPLSPQEKQELAGVVADILSLNVQEVDAVFGMDKEFKFLTRMAAPALAQALKNELHVRKILGFEFDSSFCRAYPQKSLAAQIIGFTGVDGQGLEGLELYYEKELQGEPAQVLITRDRKGGILDAQEAIGPEYDGNNLILTIDSTIQYIAEEALKKSVLEYNAKGGIAIVMIPETGAIRAIAHYPTFNLNNYRAYPEYIRRNHALADTFEPGSTMKVFLMAGAIESGMVTPDKVIYCENGSYRVGRSTINDTHRYGHLTVHDILKVSSNIGSVKVGEIIGAKTLYTALKNFGYGEKSGIDCPGEANGLMRDYRLWRPIDQATVAFGQGITVTPIQLVTAVSAVANRGMLMTPYLVQAVTDEKGNILEKMEPRPKRRVISEQTAEILMKMMSAATAPGGTGTRAVPVGYSVCGKTGTAQKLGADGTYHNCEYNGVFIGFSPMDAPKLSVLVVIDSPQRYHYGGVVAAPVFKEILEETFNYLNVPPALPEPETPDKLRLQVAVSKEKQGA